MIEINGITHAAYRGDPAVADNLVPDPPPESCCITHKNQYRGQVRTIPLVGGSKDQYPAGGPPEIPQGVSIRLLPPIHYVEIG
jgi:hypothetical protein